MAATATTFVGGAGPSGKPSANIQTVCGKGCGQVAFSPDSSKVALVAGGILFLSSRDGASLAGADWTLPTQVYPANKTDSVTYVVWSPDGSELGIGVQAQAAAPSPTLPRVVDEDVIVNVITNTHPGPATVLCTLPVVADDALTASAAATCYDTATLKGSLSMPVCDDSLCDTNSSVAVPPFRGRDWEARMSAFPLSFSFFFFFHPSSYIFLKKSLGVDRLLLAV